MKPADPDFFSVDPVAQLEQLARQRRVEHGEDDPLAERFEAGAAILRRRRGGKQRGFVFRQREPGEEG